MTDTDSTFLPGEKVHLDEGLAKREAYNEGYRVGYGDGYRWAPSFHTERHQRFQELWTQTRTRLTEERDRSINALMAENDELTHERAVLRETIMDLRRALEKKRKPKKTKRVHARLAVEKARPAFTPPPDYDVVEPCHQTSDGG